MCGGAAYYFLFYKKKHSPSPSPSPSLSTLLQSGQAIQVSEVDLATNPTFTPPTELNSTVTYSMSMDINIVNEVATWYSMLDNSKAGTYVPIGTTNRRPTVIISGEDWPGGASNIHIVHSSTDGANDNIITKFQATPGVYFNLTFVVDSGKLKTYINGVADDFGEVSAAFTWSTSENEWTWNPDKRPDSIKVKNVYWFNKALTPSEVELIGKKQTSGTSTYELPPSEVEPEPYSLM